VYWRECCAGVDEVGRGPLAGAVYAAAVILDPFAPMSGLRDSKALSEARRDALDVVIRTHALAYCVASASIKEIDEINILQASLLAMQRAVAGLNHPVDFVMVDGNRTPGFACPSEWLIKGDSSLMLSKQLQSSPRWLGIEKCCASISCIRPMVLLSTRVMAHPRT